MRIQTGGRPPHCALAGAGVDVRRLAAIDMNGTARPADHPGGVHRPDGRFCGGRCLARRVSASPGGRVLEENGKPRAWRPGYAGLRVRRTTHDAPCKRE